MPVVYHWVPAAMEGSVLYPLNDLRLRAPHVWEREREKYEGREHVLQERVPPLDCLWNDVLHLSPIHPAKIVGALADAGLETRRHRCFEIDAEALDARRAVIFMNRRHGVARSDESQWHAFDPDMIPSLTRLPEQARRYYRDCAKGGERPRLYAYLPHVLFRGSIDVRALRVVDV